ncbi:MAG: hypothetical protein WC044_01960 [Crocinitomicaceae bacterium]
MKKLTDTLVVKRIDWENNHSDMLVTCDVQNGIFSYNSTLVLPGSELNKLLSHLQKQNVDLDLNDCLKVEQWSENEIHYIFDFSTFDTSEFVYEIHFSSNKLKQIRA